MKAFPIIRTCALRTRPVAFRSNNAIIAMNRSACRTFADDKKLELPKAEPGQDGPNMKQQEHVSEEAAKIAKVQGGQGPDIEGQGTPVQEILRNEKDIRDAAPKVMKDQAKHTNITTKPSTRAFSTMARRPAEGFTNNVDSLRMDMSALPTEKQQAQWSSEQDAARQLFINTIADEQNSLESLNALQTSSGSGEGHKFPLPELPLPPNLIKKTRYDPVVEQLTNLMMQDGNKATAQRYMAFILETLRTNSPPRINPARPLLPGAPPAAHLPLNPVLYLTLAIDSIAPLLRLRVQKGGAGGGASLQIPVPLSLRQRRRTAFMWILDVCSKRKSRGSGKNMFPTKVADEIIAIVQGTSSLWERKNAIHKLAVTARAAVNFGQKGFRR